MQWQATPTLILTPRFTEDAQALWLAACELGWGVERLATWRVPKELRDVSDPELYIEALFGPALAEQLGLKLLEPPEEWLTRLPEEFRKRRVSVMPMRQAEAGEKIDGAGIYQAAERQELSRSRIHRCRITRRLRRRFPCASRRNSEVRERISQLYFEETAPDPFDLSAIRRTAACS